MTSRRLDVTVPGSASSVLVYSENAEGALIHFALLVNPTAPCPLCPPWLTPFRAGAGETESHPEWYANRSAAWPAGPLPLPPHPPAACRTKGLEYSPRPFDGLLRRRALALAVAVRNDGAGPRDHSIR